MFPETDRVFAMDPGNPSDGQSSPALDGSIFQLFANFEIPVEGLSGDGGRVLRGLPVETFAYCFILS